MKKNLWKSADPEVWKEALQSYRSVIQSQGVERLPEADRWYQHDFPKALAGRDVPCITHAELVLLVEWKMWRGVFRGRNLALVRGNDPDTVEKTSREALQQVPQPTTPITTLAKLDGVGPATASAIVAATNPEIYPFFDELVADQIPGFEKVAFSLSQYKRYAEALRERAATLGHGWSPVKVEQALWANSGGKAKIYQKSK